MAYCTVDEVCGAFPNFARMATGSITDVQIQKWIDDWTSRIDSALLDRGVAVDTIALTTRQQNFLRAVNADGAVAELGLALQGSLTLQPGEYSLAAGRRRSAERVLAEIIKGSHDVLFGVGTATPATTTKFGGIGGAETDAADTPEALEENRSFGKNQEF